MTLSAICQFRRLSANLATAGQPTADQFRSISQAGFEVTINLALPTSTNALADEGRIVTSYGMSYIHIPVEFQKPAAKDFQTFCQLMEAFAARPVFVHCAANKRVSVFAFLYRRLYQRFTLAEAERDLHAIWRPDEVWSRFIQEQIETHRPPF